MIGSVRAPFVATFVASCAALGSAVFGFFVSLVARSLGPSVAVAVRPVYEGAQFSTRGFCLE